jgi:hypothetical protein
VAIACIGTLGRQLVRCRQFCFHKLAPIFQMKLSQQGVCRGLF